MARVNKKITLDHTRGLLALLRRSGIRRGLLAVLVCGLSTLLLLDYVRIPVIEYQVGDVAQRDLRAPTSFTFYDSELTQRLQHDAEAGVQPVYDFDATQVGRLQDRISLTFDAARRKLAEALLNARAEGGESPSEQVLAAVANDFLKSLEFNIDPDVVEVLLRVGFDRAVEVQTNVMVGVAMRRYIIADRANLPSPVRAVTVIRLTGDSRQEITLEDFAQVLTPEEVRQEIALYVLENDRAIDDPQATKAAANIARAAVRVNFSYNQLLTEERKQDARESVVMVKHQVKRGTTLFRAGDVLEQQQVDMLQALRRSARGPGLLGEIISLLAVCTLVIVTFFLFGAGYVRSFANDTRNLEAMGFILLLLLALARLSVDASGEIFTEGGAGPLPSSFWYLVPLAGGAMLMRILANSETALVFAIVASLLTGVMMDQQAFFILFFLVSSVTAAGSLSQTHERFQILRAGMQTAVINGAVVIIIDLVHVHLGSTTAVTLPVVLWDIFFAMLGGMLSAVMVLGLVPFFELFGFVTDYKLLELSSLNHPLLRQLMLRAPGTYHHSVIVGNLCEAAAESIGANTLMVRVAAYFHDVGKVVKPHFFVENQRDIPNPHDRLAADRSAAVLVNHVVDGVALAREHRLPEPIVDAITMHHGTGMIVYFYDRACKAAGLDGYVDPAGYRYPGPRPNTREMGILHLADKVEAATRAIERPTTEKVREVIQKTINKAMNDGQFEECPLTLKDLYTIANAFEEVLMGIYHHRIEYPDGKSVITQETPRQSVITLEITNPLHREERSDGGEEAREETRDSDPSATTSKDHTPDPERTSADLDDPARDLPEVK